MPKDRSMFQRTGDATPSRRTISPCDLPARRLGSQRSRALPKRCLGLVSSDPFGGRTVNDGVSNFESASQGLPRPPMLMRERVPEKLVLSLPAIPTTSSERKLQDALARNRNLEARIRRLETTQSKLKEKLQDRVEALRDARMEAERAETELLKAGDAHARLAATQEELEDLATSTKVLEHEAEKFRKWWLTEYHSLQVTVSLLPNPEDLEHILSASQARFSSYSN